LSAAAPAPAHLRAVLGIALAAAVWGWAFPATRFLLDAGLSVGALLTLRFAIGGTALLVLALATGATWRRRDILDGILLGLILSALFWLQTDGLRFTTTTKNAFITGLYVIFTPLVALGVGDRLRPIHGAAALVAFAGMVLLVFKPGESFGGWHPRGDTFTLLNALLVGVHIVFTAHVARRADPWVLAFVQVALTAAVSALVVVLFPSVYGFRGGQGLQEPGVWVALGFLGLVATTLAFWLQSRFQAQLGATEAGVLLSLEPVWATLLAVSGIVPGVRDRLGPLQWGGAALLLGAALLAELGPRCFNPGPADGDAIG
jgi:drug/metabolite transporter (DMT)-like permease